MIFFSFDLKGIQTVKFSSAEAAHPWRVAYQHFFVQTLEECWFIGRNFFSTGLDAVGMSFHV
jgi:hypothetical protein